MRHRIWGCVFAPIACRGLCPDLAVGVVFTGVFPPPGFNYLWHGGGFHRQNVVQPCVNECLFVRRGEHPRISNDGNLVELVGILEPCDHREHRVGLCRVASKRAHMQWKPGGISKQPDKDLWLYTALF